MILLLISLIPVTLILNNLWQKYRAVNKKTETDIMQSYCDLQLRKKYKC